MFLACQCIRGTRLVTYVNQAGRDHLMLLAPGLTSFTRARLRRNHVGNPPLQHAAGMYPLARREAKNKSGLQLNFNIKRGVFREKARVRKEFRDTCCGKEL